MQLIRGQCVRHREAICLHEDSGFITCPTCIVENNKGNIETLRKYQLALADEIGRAREKEMQALNALQVMVVARGQIFARVSELASSAICAKLGDDDKTLMRDWLDCAITGLFANGDSMAKALLKELAK